MVRVIRAIVRDRLALRICTVVNNAAGTVVSIRYRFVRLTYIIDGQGRNQAMLEVAKELCLLLQFRKKTPRRALNFSS